ncbi:MAG: HAD family hydrolase [Chloroflexi bacterium]|nr:HAD family hydrolase [Chloroflexota bacterium]
MALIIFDYDGVLADTLDDLLQFGQEACDELVVRHVVTTEDLCDLEVMSFATYGRACEVPEERIEEFVQFCLKRSAEKESPPAIFDGLDDIVRRLAERHRIAVVTSNSSPNVNAFLAKHGLESCVDAVYGLDFPGSKAQKIAIAREQLTGRTIRESVFVVGDSLSDIRAAKEASAISIAVTWGHQRLEHLLRGNPDHVIHSPHELIEIIEKK